MMLIMMMDRFQVCTGRACFRNSGFEGMREIALSLQKTDEIFRAHETMIQQMKVVRGASIGDTDPSDVNAYSKKPKGGVKAPAWHGRFPRGADSRVKTCDLLRMYP